MADPETPATPGRTLPGGEGGPSPSSATKAAVTPPPAKQLMVLLMAQEIEGEAHPRGAVVVMATPLADAARAAKTARDATQADLAVAGGARNQIQE